MGKKLLSILLALAMLLSMVPAAFAEDTDIVVADEAFAEDIVIEEASTDEAPADEAVVIDGLEIHVNPLFRDQISAEEIAASLREADETSAVSADCGTLEDAAAALRAGMRARESSITINYTGAGSVGYEELMDLALAHTGQPTEGDYLRWQYGGLGVSYGSNRFSFQISYYTTAAQEAEMDAAVTSTLNQLSLDGKTDYQKVCAIYDFICANTVYDNEHYGDNSYLLQYTAYAAMINKTAVCQGYANLLYRLLLSVGVDTRIVTSDCHAWNIVRLRNLYYNADSTWDAGAYGDYYWFLRNMDNFSDGAHVREAPYSEDAFYIQYPMDPTDYDDSAAARTGWQKVGIVWYYFNDAGVIVTDWQRINGTWYYFSARGAMQTGWQRINGYWYYLSAGGVMQTGWQQIGGTWYYFAPGGAMQTGWQKLGGGIWYYFLETGAMATGWQRINGTWYYFAPGGAMQTGWQRINGTWYYFAPGGAMQTGWQKIGGYWYYFAPGGAMQTGWQKINDTWYYFAPGGTMQTGWLKSDGYWFYLDASGAMLANTSREINGKVYYFNASGVCTNP
ncbi:MAG: transglutaminase domain-containing protein [Clostridia bacterium]